MDNSGASRNHKFQLIDDQAEMRAGLTDFLREIGISNDEKQYNIISVIGPQSSGKSTLLNNLFGTNFVTAEVAGPQTTRGIWVSRDQQENIIVLDIEGSDSLEQQFRTSQVRPNSKDSPIINESQQPNTNAMFLSLPLHLENIQEKQRSKEFYELSTGLFALQMSNVFLINVLQNQSGQDNGSGFSVLRYIIKLNIELFKKRTLEEKKRIIIVIRDAKQGQYENNKTRMMQNLNREWEILDKPEEMAAMSLQELFAIDIICLPHYEYLPEQFKTEVRQFHDMFVRSLQEGNSASINLPAGDLGDFAEQIWDVIKNNQDVDIPAQKDLLAEKQCQKAKKKVAESAYTDIEKLSNLEDQSFGQSAQLIWSTVVQEYQKLTKKYQQKVAVQVQQELETELIDKLKIQVRDYLRTAVRKVRDQLDHEFERQIEQMNAERLKKMEAYQHCVQSVKQIAQSEKEKLAHAREGTRFEQLKSNAAYAENWEQILKQETEAAQEIDKNVDIFVRQQIDSIIAYRKSEVILRQVRDRVETVFLNLHQSPDNFWQQINEKFEILLKQEREAFQRILAVAEKSQQENEYWQKQRVALFTYEKIEEIIVQEKIKNVDKLQSFLVTLLHGMVDFKIAPKKLSEIEHSRIDTVYDECKQTIIHKVIDQFRSFTLNPGKELADISIGKPIFTVQEIDGVKKWFDKRAEELKEQAKTMKYFGFLKQVPWQMWVIVLFFAYDDIMRMLFSPFWLTLTIFVASSIFYLQKNEKGDLIFKAIKFVTGIIEKLTLLFKGVQAVR